MQKTVQQAIRDEVAALMTYLTSDKFRVDTTVQVQDILNRLEMLRSLAM